MIADLVIRPAEARDDAAIGELLVTSFITAYAAKLPEVVYSEARKGELRDVATKRREAIVLVAERADRVIGTVALYPPGAAKSEAWLPNTGDLRQLAVHPDHFGEGLSAPLLDAIEAAAWALGVVGITLHVRRGADGVARMYQRRGYARAPDGDLMLPEVELLAYVRLKP